MPKKVRNASANAPSADNDCVTIITRRRSMASATTPLTIEKNTTGATRARPTNPSASPFFPGSASNDTCHSSAAFCIVEPVKEISRPIQINRKFRWRRATIERPKSEAKHDVRLVRLFDERRLFERQGD